MTKSSMKWWERFLFRDRGILPTNKLLVVIIILSFCLWITTFYGVSWTFIIIANMVVISLSLLDLLFSPKKKELRFNRVMPDEMERGITYSVQLKIENHSQHDMEFQFVDSLPQSFKSSFPVKGSAPKGKAVEVSYGALAPVRGKYTLDKLYFRYRSSLGLWEKQVTIQLEDTVKVIPDLTSVKNYLDDAQRFLMYDGMKIRKNKSGFGEFSKIRNYVVGDDPRKINWRQTAKVQEVMTNEYEPEHGKYITILIDCGRMMGAELKEGNRLEKAIEAALTVAAAALQKGDYVSVIAFSKDVKVFVPPEKGMGHLQRILHSLYDVEVDGGESNYGEILNYLQAHQKKRSLLLLFSDVLTFLNEESALHYLQRLRQRHLFLMIGIEDETLLARVSDDPIDVQTAMVKTIAQKQLTFKKWEKTKWENKGLLMVEAREEKLANAAVSHYIQIINRGLL